ncbi:MAG: serine hydrolase [Lapillicoccus sp.]
MLALTATILASLMLGPNPATAANPAPTPTMGAASTELEAALNDVVAAGVPGIVARVQEGHRAARDYAAGVGDLATGAALRPTATYRVGSITKTFVATIVLQLVGEGRIGLDEPIARRLPRLLANGNQITVRQLLNHTSGLPDYNQDPELFAGIVKNRVWRPRELVALAERHPQLFAPGSAWGYSNTNYIVAGLLIEAVAGHPLARELDRRIFFPLRLDHTSFPVGNAPLTGYHAHGYISTEAIPTPDGQPLDVTGYNPSYAWAAGAIVSNAADLSHFYQALMGGKLLGAALLREMRKTVAEDPTDPHTTFRYGLGLERVNDACGVNWGLGGAIFGYEGLAYWNARTGRTVVIASTMNPAPAAANTPLATLTGLALCPGNSTSASTRQRQLPRSQDPASAQLLGAHSTPGGA